MEQIVTARVEGKNTNRWDTMKFFTAICFFVVSLALGQESDSLDLQSDSLSVVDSILAQAVSYLGVPYVWGGTDENGFDCSGLAYRVFNDNGIALPRTVTAMGEVGTTVSRDSLQPGDLLIFHNPTHTGIYMGNGEFIHCSSWQDRGVVITEITQSNYARRYYSAVRVIPSD